MMPFGGCDPFESLRRRISELTAADGTEAQIEHLRQQLSEQEELYQDMQCVLAATVASRDGMEQGKELPQEQVLPPSGPDVHPGDSPLGKVRHNAAVFCVEQPTQMMLLNKDGSKKHRRWFWVDATARTLSWAKEPRGVGKGPFLLTAVEQRPGGQLAFTTNGEDALAKPADQTLSDTWLCGCQQILVGAELGPAPVSEPVPEPEPMHQRLGQTTGMRKWSGGLRPWGEFFDCSRFNRPKHHEERIATNLNYYKVSGSLVPFIEYLLSSMIVLWAPA